MSRYAFQPWRTLACVSLLLNTLGAAAENWPQWRGPQFNGATTETNLPARLNPQTAVLWATPLPGRSGATPVIWEDSVFVPSPVTAPGLVFACGPKREMLVAIRGAGSGSVGENQVAWKIEQYIPDVSTPLSYQGKLFVLDGDRQVMTAYQPQTGQLLWQGRLGLREIFYASPTGADGKIYCLSEEGTLVVLSAGDQFQLLSTTPFGEGPCRSSIVISGGRFFIRTAKTLYCLK